VKKQCLRHPLPFLAAAQPGSRRGGASLLRRAASVALRACRAARACVRPGAAHVPHRHLACACSRRAAPQDKNQGDEDANTKFAEINNGAPRLADASRRFLPRTSHAVLWPSPLSL